MKTMIKSKTELLELENGTSVKLTLNFSRLMYIRSSRKDIYKRYNDIMMDGPKDIFDNITILYTAYLCALEDGEKELTEKEFIENLPPYQQLINQIVMDLTRPKKKADSEKPSVKGDPESQNE